MIGYARGIHHVTAIASDPQRNRAFYSDVLGLRLVKKTVNFDDSSSYHLYYGDGRGTPGTIMTFFAWTAVPPLSSAHGRAGAQQLVSVAFAVPRDSLTWWADRLAALAVDYEERTQFGERVLLLRDPDAMDVELVERDVTLDTQSWAASPVNAAHAITGIAGVTILVNREGPGEHFLTRTMQFGAPRRDENRLRFDVGAGAVLDLVVDAEAAPGRMGIGAIHHVAWRTASPGEQQEWRSYLMEAGLHVTEVMDRQYFESIYFRDPNGVVNEIATDAPGFAVDEAPEELGRALKLPPWLEPRRDRIEAKLPAL